MINYYIKDGKLKVFVKPNKSKNNIIYGDNNELIIELNAQPEDNKANTELLKFLKKQTKKQWKIISGFKSRNKVLELI